MNPRTAKSWAKKIEKQRDAVGVRRDAIRDLIAELGDLEDVCTRAWEDLDSAASALSEFA